MNSLNLRVVEIATNALDTEYESSNLIYFVPILREMLWCLEEFHFTDCEHTDQTPMDLFTDFPVKYLSHSEFEIEDGKVFDTVETLTKFKSLERLDIDCHWSCYELTLDEFALFQHLPVYLVDFGSLKINEDNIFEFRQIMLRMKIEKITQRNLGEMTINIVSHGPGGMYKTV
eukprot:TCONS_00039328-protein